LIEAAKEEGEVMIQPSPLIRQKLSVTSRMNKYLATVSFVAINRQAHHPNAARLSTDCLLGPETQKIFGNLGEYVFQPVVDHKFNKDVKDDRIVFVKLPSAEDLESWNKKFQEMFR